MSDPLTPPDDEPRPGEPVAVDARVAGWIDEGRPLEDASWTPPERRRAADGLWLNSLLQQTLRRDSVARERRVIRVTTAITDLARQTQSSNTPMGAPARRRRWWAPLTAAAVCLLALAIWRPFGAPSLTAVAAVQASLREASEAPDRRYRVTLTLAEETSTREVAADLWVRGGTHYVWRQAGPLGDFVIGSDGRQHWVTPSVGPIIVGTQPGLLEQAVLGEQAGTEFLQITSILARLAERYELQLLPEENLPAVDGSQTLRCTHVLGRRRPAAAETDGLPRPPETIELWTARQSGIAQKLVLNWPQEVREQRLLEATFALLPLESPVEETWYSHEAHHAPDRRIIDRDTVGESEPDTPAAPAP
jgi:hypothetical protein